MRTRCHVLMLAVMKRAVADLESPSASVRGEARGWFLSRNAGGNVFTFGRICQEFGFDATEAAAQILARGNGVDKATDSRRGRGRDGSLIQLS